MSHPEENLCRFQAAEDIIVRTHKSRAVWLFAMLLVGSEGWTGASYERATIVQVIKQASTIVPIPNNTGTADLIPAFPNYQITIRVADTLYLTACHRVECSQLQVGETLDVRRKDQKMIVKPRKTKKVEVYVLTTMPADR